MRKFILLSVMFGQLALLENSFGETVSVAKGAELSLHRVERLVVLKKIDLAFQSMLKNLFIEVVPQENPGEAFFNVTVKQFPAADGNTRNLLLSLNEEGKTLKHVVEGTSNGEGAPIWSDKDPVTLGENALHFVLEESEKGNPDVIPFNTALTSFDISQIALEDGALKASVKMTSSEVTKVLEVILNLDGTYHSHKFL